MISEFEPDHTCGTAAGAGFDLKVQHGIEPGVLDAVPSIAIGVVAAGLVGKLTFRLVRATRRFVETALVEVASR